MTRHPLTAAIGDTLTGYHGEPITITRHDPRDHTCGLCGGLVQVWDRYKLARPKVSGPGAYDTTEESAHLMATGLLGGCPEVTR